MRRLLPSKDLLLLLLAGKCRAPNSVDHDSQVAPSVFTKAACLTMAAEIRRKALELAESRPSFDNNYQHYIYTLQHFI